jgi:hypothetical protein
VLEPDAAFRLEKRSVNRSPIEIIYDGGNKLSNWGTERVNVRFLARAQKAGPNAKAFGPLPFVALARNRKTQAGAPLGRRVGVESTY